MMQTLLRSRSLCLVAASSCLGGGSAFLLQEQQETVRVVRKETLQLLSFLDPLTVGELLEQLNVPHHCVRELTSSFASSSEVSPGSSSLELPASRFYKGPMLGADAVLDVGCLYFLSPLPTLLQKGSRWKLCSSSAASSDLFSSRISPSDATDRPCCCGTQNTWDRAPAASRPFFTSSLREGVCNTSSQAAQPDCRLPRKRRSLPGSLSALKVGELWTSSKRKGAMDLTLQAVVSSEQLSGAAKELTTMSCLLASPATTGMPCGVIGYASLQCLRNTWKPELRRISETSESSAPQFHSNFSLLALNSYGERSSFAALAGRTNGGNLFYDTQPTSAAEAFGSVGCSDYGHSPFSATASPIQGLDSASPTPTSCRADSSRSPSRSWRSELSDLTAFGGFTVSAGRRWGF